MLVMTTEKVMHTILETNNRTRYIKYNLEHSQKYLDM